jgi:amino acid permease
MPRFHVAPVVGRYRLWLLCQLDRRRWSAHLVGYLLCVSLAFFLLSYIPVLTDSSYIRFNKGLRVQGIERSTLPYAAFLNKRAFAAKYAIVLISM